jgi:DHA2 family multidrug resistance protein
VGRMITVIDPRLMVAAGLTLLSLSGYLFAGLTLQISVGNVVGAAILNGMSTGMIFVPLSLLTLGRLRNEQMGNAAGLYTLMRNLGGSVGIAIATTLLARGAQAHQAVLATHLTPYDPAYEHARQSLQRVLGLRTDPVTASQQALGLLYHLLVQQATLLAFLDVFRAISLLALVCVPLAFLFGRIRPRRKAPATSDREGRSA